MAIRISTVGLLGSACYVAGDLAWLALARPPGVQLLLAWAVALGAVGLFVPGLANQVTLARAHLAGPALVYSLFPSRLLQLAAVVTVAGVSDLLDGAAARRFRQQSRLGGGLDPVVDGLFFGAVGIGEAIGGAYPLWLALVVLARYGVPAAAVGALLLLGRRPPLRHTPVGQASTTLIAFLLGGIALFHGLGWPTSSLVLVSEVVLPLATLATFANLFWIGRASVLGRA